MNVMLAGPDERECARLLDELGQAFNGAFGLAARYEIAQAPNDIARAKRLGRRPINRIGKAVVRHIVACQQHPTAFQIVCDRREGLIAFVGERRRSEERRVGKEGGSTWRSRWSP